ncbi:beta-lactamase [Xylariales sp. PMI_506]|nr:beta-lactamase [Xylariales sp. PMI_506]
MEAFEQLMNQAVEDKVILGAVVCAKSLSGNVDYCQPFGYRRVQPQPEPMERDTGFLIASMTKLMTTIAALQVVERGLIGLDDDVTGYLPVLARQEILLGFDDDDDNDRGKVGSGKAITRKREKPITLRQLLTHSFGGPYRFMSPEIMRYEEEQQQQQQPTVGARPRVPSTVDEAFGTPLLREPGESWFYGGGLDWAGKLVAELTGADLETHMRRHIWEPLGLRDITFWPQSHRGGGAQALGSDRRLAAMSIRDPATGAAAQSRKPINISAGMTEACGGQGAAATMPDFVEILRSLLAGPEDERLLPAGTKDAMFRPQLSPASKAALLAAFESPEWAIGSFPPTGEYDWGLGGLLIDGDKHPYRRKGTMIWSGNANLYWFIDRSAGVCGVFGCQLLPPADVKIQKLLDAFERAAYSAALPNSKL